jgi:phage/plasmid-like protein (TIGR03299 family)
MAHMLEETGRGAAMAYVGEVPWHGLGKQVERGVTEEEMLDAAQLAWDVEKVPVYVATGNEVEGVRYVECKENAAIRRASDGKVLGVVGIGYEPVQNREAFASIASLRVEGHAEWETAGSIKGGKVVWALLKLNEPFEVVPGDEVRSYLLVTNNHDGSRVFQARFTTIRVVCNNTLGMAIGNQRNRTQADREFDAKDGTIRIRHTKNVSESVKEAGKILAATVRAAKKTAAMYQMMQKAAVSGTRMKEMIEELIPPTASQDQTGVSNIRNEIFRLSEEGAGTQIPGVRGTVWGFYNAATEYVDHVRAAVPESTKKGPVPPEKVQAAKDSRLGQIWFGTGFSIKHTALKIAQNEVGAEVNEEEFATA